MIILAILNFLFAALVLSSMIIYKPWKKSVVEMVVYGITFILPVVSGVALMLCYLVHLVP